MPTYSYHCPNHGEFEALRKISERDSAECKQCGSISYKLVDAQGGITDGYYNQNMSVRPNRQKQVFRSATR